MHGDELCGHMTVLHMIDTLCASYGYDLDVEL